MVKLFDDVDEIEHRRDQRSEQDDKPNYSEYDEINYLGDGVYASFDGYQIWLRVNDSDSEPLVALEAAVMHSLIGYAIKMRLVSKHSLQHEGILK
jgi:hypothetical protein